MSTKIRRVRATSLPSNPRPDTLYEVSGQLYLGSAKVSGGGGAAENVVAVTSDVVISGSAGGAVYRNESAADRFVTPSPGSGPFSIQKSGSGNVSVRPPAENWIANNSDYGAAYWLKNAAQFSVVASPDAPPPGVTAPVFLMTVLAQFASIRPASNISLGSAVILMVYEVWVQGSPSAVGKTVAFGDAVDSRWATTVLNGQWQKLTYVHSPATSNLKPAIDVWNNGANMGAGDTLKICGFAAYRYGIGDVVPAVTTGAQVMASYRVTGETSCGSEFSRIDFREDTAGFFVGEPSSNQGSGTGFLLIRPGGKRESTIVLAAADSRLPYESDYILSGNADDLIITQAFNSLRGVGGRVLLRSGTYLLTDAVVLDSDWTTLEGEAPGWWGRYLTYTTPNVGREGVPGGAKLRQTISGKGCITEGTTYTNGDVRHKAIGLKNLYMYGAGMSGTAVSFKNGSIGADIVRIENCGVHNWANGFDLSLDACMITGNTIQSCSGFGISSSGPYGIVSGNIVYDIGGDGIVLEAASRSTVVSGNTFGHNTGANVRLRGKGAVLTANSIDGPLAGATSGDGVVLETGAEYNTVSGNLISINTLGGSPNLGNTIGTGVKLTGASRNTVSGNTIVTQASATSYAVDVSSAACTGNTVVGNTCAGNWNGGGAEKIRDLGTSTKVYANAGDSR